MNAAELDELGRIRFYVDRQVYMTDRPAREALLATIKARHELFLLTQLITLLQSQAKLEADENTADVILVSEASPTEYLQSFIHPSMKAAMVSFRFIEDCKSQGKRLPFQKYIVNVDPCDTVTFRAQVTSSR